MKSNIYKIDFVSVEFSDEKYENDWTYVIGYDSGNDYTKPQEKIDTLDDDICKKIEEIRNVCFPRE
jgi:hypothetical protein